MQYFPFVVSFLNGIISKTSYFFFLVGGRPPTTGGHGHGHHGVQIPFISNVYTALDTPLIVNLYSQREFSRYSGQSPVNHTAEAPHSSA